MIDIVINIFQILFWFLVILVPLVVIHEFGHLLFARLFGVKIPEFGIGLPFSKHKISKKYKGINWSIYPWLLGGFVRIYGDHDELDEHYEMAKTDPVKARESYKEKRVIELLANDTVDNLLKDNFIDFDDGWKWFSKIDYLTVEDIDSNSDKIFNKLLKGIKSAKVSPISDLDYDKDSFIKSPVKYFKALSSQKQLELKDKLTDEYKRLLNLITTLSEWEFDSKIVSKNKNVLKTAFFYKNIIAQIFIISGGVIFNFLAAILLFMISFSVLGTIPETFTIDRQPILGEQITQYRKDYKVDILSKGLTLSLADDSALKEAGLKNGDELFQIGDRNIQEDRIQDLDDLANELDQYDNQTVEIKYLRDGKEFSANAELKKEEIDGEEKVRLGAYVGYKVKRYSKGFFSILPDAIGETGKITSATFGGIVDIIKATLPNAENREALNSVAGPIGVGYASGLVFSTAGISGVVYLMALISIALAVFNILPLPALDGGRLVLLLINKITKKRSKKIEGIAISVTFILLILLAVLVARVDIMRIIGN